MTTPSPEAIEAAARAWAIHDETDGCFERVDAWEALEDWEREAHPDEYPESDYEDCADYRERATAALSAAAPIIAAHAKAEALREAAEDPTLRRSGHRGISSTSLRARADQIEGKSA